MYRCEITEHSIGRFKDVRVHVYQESQWLFTVSAFRAAVPLQQRLQERGVPPDVAQRLAAEVLSARTPLRAEKGLHARTA